MGFDPNASTHVLDKLEKMMESTLNRIQAIQNKIKRFKNEQLLMANILNKVTLL
jgi:hypothetical protein